MLNSLEWDHVSHLPKDNFFCVSSDVQKIGVCVSLDVCVFAWVSDFRLFLKFIDLSNNKKYLWSEYPSHLWFQHYEWTLTIHKKCWKYSNPRDFFQFTLSAGLIGGGDKIRKSRDWDSRSTLQVCGVGMKLSRLFRGRDKIFGRLFRGRDKNFWRLFRDRDKHCFFFTETDYPKENSPATHFFFFTAPQAKKKLQGLLFLRTITSSHQEMQHYRKKFRLRRQCFTLHLCGVGMRRRRLIRGRDKILKKKWFTLTDPPPL